MSIVKHISEISLQGIFLTKMLGTWYVHVGNRFL